MVGTSRMLHLYSNTLGAPGPVGSMGDYLSRIREAIASGELSAEIVEHPETDGAKSEDAAKAAGVPVESILKALLLMPEKEGGTVVVAILLGNSKLDFKKKLPTHKMAKLADLQEKLGAGIGEIPPVFLPLPVLVDKKVMEKGLVVGSAGTKFAGLKLAPAQILKHNRIARIADISA